MEWDFIHHSLVFVHRIAHFCMFVDVPCNAKSTEFV